MNHERIRTRENAQAPAVCFICEMIQGEVLVDMCRNFDPEQPMTPLRGRKYLCEACVKDAAFVLDLGVSQDELDFWKKRAEEMELAADDAEALTMKVVSVEEFLAGLKPLFEGVEEIRHSQVTGRISKPKAAPKPKAGESE